MSISRTKTGGVVVIILLLLFLDQALKIWIKTNFNLHESREIFPWFHLFFTENPGMAFGLEVIDKRILSIVRIFAAILLAIFLVRIIKRNYSFGFTVCIALIFVGAVGNIFDSVFYGNIFDTGTVFNPDIDRWVGYQGISKFSSNGYAPALQGCVVDMLYFPLIDTTLPSWLPVWGGKDFVFFRPIFNLADSSICVGVFALLIFFRRTLSKSLSKE
ncbi:MAG: lipoprotein signal peptidase [Tannerella sp.]|jgi:signal peptidase II|nr:lipoprotein signal peptidase [Tannerella sp.]